MMNKVFKSKVFVFMAISSISLLIFPLDVLSQPQFGSSTGIIYYENSKNPLPGAVVMIKNIVTGQVYQSAPTDKAGAYSIPQLPPGRYIIGVSALGGNYNFEQEVVIKANEIAKLSLVLKPGNKPAAILAGGKGFFATPFGIAVAVLGAAAATAGIISVSTPAAPAASASIR